MDRVANVFLNTAGDLKSVYLAIFESPEFWSESSFEVKTKTESTGPWDLYKLVATTPAADAVRPLSDGGCKLVGKS